METIKNYLDTMFANMPDTEDVKRAKSELLQMMEDKYNELIAEGISENSAIGTVISEFGNLDEIAEDLGLNKDIDVAAIEEEAASRRNITLDEAKDYIAFKGKFGLAIGFGVLLCITCVCPAVLIDSINLPEAFGITLMFTMIAIAVGIFIYNGVMASKWNYLKKTLCQLEMSTVNYVNEEQNRYRSTHALILTIGIILCVICWVPAAALTSFNAEIIGALLLFVLVGIGVMMIIYTATIYSSYDELLKLTMNGTMRSSAAKVDDVEYINDGVKIMMELYWPVMTAAYLIWSFVTFEWWKTWIIWPIAAIIHVILKTGLKKR